MILSGQESLRDPLAVYVQIYNSFQSEYMNAELLYLLQTNDIINHEELCTFGVFITGVCYYLVST